jgi:hypothetical protein
MQIEDFSDKNKQTIEKFLQELVRSGLKPKSLVRYSIVMSWFSKTCDFSKITVEDTDKFFFFIIGKDISQMSKNFYWIRFRKFINWLRPSSWQSKKWPINCANHYLGTLTSHF